jgi:Amidase
MSYGFTGVNEHYGQAKNPYNKGRITGGSSSGSGASVAARLVQALWEVIRWARSAFLLFLRCRRISSNVMMAAMSFRTLNARQLVEKVVGGTKYDDAEEVKVRDAA